MLSCCRATNHRSIRHEPELNLRPVRDDEAESQREVLPVAGVFGSNASGKSNVIDALSVMRSAALGRQWVPRGDLDDVDGPRYRDPSALAPEVAAEKSSFEVDLGIGGLSYRYGFRLGVDDVVLGEWPYSYLDDVGRVHVVRGPGAVPHVPDVGCHRETRPRVCDEWWKPSSIEPFESPLTGDVL